MVVEQVVDLPASRRIILDLPQTLPVGKVRISVFPVPAKAKTDDTASKSPPDNNGKICLTNEMKEELLNDEMLLSLTGILHTDMTLDEIRTERLAKHL